MKKKQIDETLKYTRHERNEARRYADQLEKERDEAREIAKESCELLAENGFETNYPPMPWHSHSRMNVKGDGSPDTQPNQTR